MSKRLTQAQIETDPIPEVFSEPLTQRTPRQVLAEFWQDHARVIVFWSCVAVATLLVSIYVFFPAPDLEVVVLSSKMELTQKDARSLERRMVQRQSRYVLDINGDGAQAVKAYVFYQNPDGEPLLSAEKTRQNREKLQKLLDSGRSFVFIADEPNAAWLSASGIARETELTLKPARYWETLLGDGFERVFGYVVGYDGLHALLVGSKLMLSEPPVTTGELSSDEKLLQSFSETAKQYCCMNGVGQLSDMGYTLQQ